MRWELKQLMIIEYFSEQLEQKTLSLKEEEKEEIFIR
jgi:hypothetical protein